MGPSLNAKLQENKKIFCFYVHTSILTYGLFANWNASRVAGLDRDNDTWSPDFHVKRGGHHYFYRSSPPKIKEDAEGYTLMGGNPHLSEGLLNDYGIPLQNILATILVLSPKYSGYMWPPLPSILWVQVTPPPVPHLTRCLTSRQISRPRQRTNR